MNNKKGVSAMIETVLLILVVIAAVGIVAGLLVPMIRTAGERTASCQGLIDIPAASASSITILQSKSIAPATLSSVLITLYNNTGATGTPVTVTLSGVGVANTTTSLGTVVNARKVSAIATIVTSSGTTVACPAVEAAIA
jgi:hypothetical protein